MTNTTTILHIKSSSNLQSSVSRKIGKTAVEHLQSLNGATVIERDLATQPVPHLSPELLGAMFTNDESGLALSNQLIDEVFASDIILIEAPMYNFGVPSVLKAWIDHILRAHKTFKYGANGPEALVHAKKAILVLAKGGIYSEGPAQAMDFQEPFLRAVLGFIGITDVEVIRIEGVMMGEEKAAAAVSQATEQAGKLQAA